MFNFSLLCYLPNLGQGCKGDGILLITVMKGPYLLGSHHLDCCCCHPEVKDRTPENLAWLLAIIARFFLHTAHWSELDTWPHPTNPTGKNYSPTMFLEEK